MLRQLPSPVCLLSHPYVVALVLAAVLNSCNKQEPIPITSPQPPTLEISAETPDFESTPASAILREAEALLDENLFVSIIRFSRVGENADIRVRFRVEPGGVVGCPGCIRLRRESYDWDEENLQDDETAERLSTLSYTGHLTGSTPILLLLVDEDAPASRLFDLAKLVRGLDPTIEFRLISEN